MKRRKIHLSLSLPFTADTTTATDCHHYGEKVTNQRLFSSINRLLTFADRYLIASFDFPRHSRHWCGIENRWLACETIESSAHHHHDHLSLNRLLIDLIDSNRFFDAHDDANVLCTYTSEPEISRLLSGKKEKLKKTNVMLLHHFN